MGRDKATLDADGAPLLVRVASALGRAGATEVRVALGDASREARYRALVPHARFVADAVADGGPVAGLVAGLADAPAGPVLIAPVDAPFLAPAAYGPLLRALEGRDAAAWTSARGSRGGVAWLFGVFDARRAGAVLAAALAAGEREVAGACRGLNAAFLPEQDLLAIPGGKRHLDNWNEPGDVVAPR